MTDYDKIKALNWSTLKYLAVSALLYRYRLDNPEPPKPHYVIGNAIHCRVLEPDDFADRYAVCTITRNKRHAAYQEWLEEHEGAQALTAAEFDNVRRAGDAVLAHPVAARILKGCRAEEPLTWTDPETGLACKGRLDAICPAYFADLKTTTDITARKFYADAAKWMYHGQLSMYQTGAIATRKIDGKQPPYLIAVEKDPPFDVSADVIKPDDLAAGRALCLQLMRRLQDCVAADMWPGKAPDLRYMDLPPWTAGLTTESEEW